MNVKKGDIVKVISGSKGLKNLQGKVISVDRKAQRIAVEGGPVNKRHLKPEKSKKFPEGGIIEKPRYIHISNVVLISNE